MAMDSTALIKNWLLVKNLGPLTITILGELILVSVKCAKVKFMGIMSYLEQVLIPLVMKCYQHYIMVKC